jgi:hypothetical protein
MAKRRPFYVARERGVAVPVYKYEQRKKGKSYAYYTVVDQSGDTRRLLTLSDPEDAKQKADSVAQAIRAAQPELVEYDAFKLDITSALDVLKPHGLKLLPAAQLLASALGIVNASELLSACHYWKQRPGKPITPRPVKTAVAEFLARHKVSPRRQRTNTAYLAMFKQQFGERNVCDLQVLDIKDWAYAKTWKERTRNDVLGTVSLFFKDAVERGLAASNPAAFKRKKVKGGTISTFAPEDAERILHGVDEDLRAFLAIIFFSGVRKEEAARLTWTQLNAASRACRPPGDRWPCPSTRLRPW